MAKASNDPVLPYNLLWDKVKSQIKHINSINCRIIKSLHLDLRSAPTDRLVDKSSIFAVYINMGSHIS